MLRAAIGIILIASTASLAAPAAPLEVAEEIVDCVQGNLPERTSVQRIELRSRDRAGSERVLRSRLHWRRFDGGRPRVRIRVDEPPDLKGASYLLIENEDSRESEMFVHLPAVGRVRRVTQRTVSDSLWGTDFSYDDMRQLQWQAAEGAHTRLPDATVSGRDVYVLALEPRPEDESSYDRIVSSVDHETCVVLRIEFYERGDAPRKVLSADPSSLSSEGGLWLARKFEMRDLRDETTSWLEILEVETDVEVPARIFNPTFLDRGR
jgi:outer membrane lipoprotein-sorting protein